MSPAKEKRMDGLLLGDIFESSNGVTYEVEGSPEVSADYEPSANDDYGPEIRVLVSAYLGTGSCSEPRYYYASAGEIVTILPPNAGAPQ